MDKAAAGKLPTRGKVLSKPTPELETVTAMQALDSRIMTEINDIRAIAEENRRNIQALAIGVSTEHLKVLEAALDEKFSKLAASLVDTKSDLTDLKQALFKRIEDRGELTLGIEAIGEKIERIEETIDRHSKILGQIRASFFSRYLLRLKRK